MSLSVVLEVVLGLSFLFALLSLVASGVNELFAGTLRLRARTLKQGVTNLFADGADADSFYRHPLIQSLYRGQRLPSYIPRDKFALALIDAKVRPAVGAVAAQLSTVSTTIQALPPGPVKDSLDLFWRDANNNVERFRRSIETWFDDAMERVSGWYRRLTQTILLGIGLVLAVGLNVNTITVAQRLWTDAPLRSAVVEQARRAAPPAASDEVAVEDALENVQSGLRAVTELSLPIGWTDQARPSTWYVAVAGWLLTTMAIAMGAPFWFDLLGRVARLRSSGVRPPTSLPPSAESERATGMSS